MADPDAGSILIAAPESRVKTPAESISTVPSAVIWILAAAAAASVVTRDKAPLAATVNTAVSLLLPVIVITLPSIATSSTVKAVNVPRDVILPCATVANVPAIVPPETLIPALNTGIWSIVTTPAEEIAIEFVSEADPIFPSSGIIRFPPSVAPALNVARPAALPSIVRNVVSEAPSVPLKIISLSFAAASTVIFPELVVIKTAASPTEISSAATPELPGKASKAGGLPAPVEVRTCPSEPVAIATGSPDAS